MRRREFITVLLAGAAISSPKAGHAQQHPLPVIGYLSTVKPASTLQDFLSGLAENGFVEGQNVAIEYRWAEGRMTGCLIWRQSWFAVASMSSLRSAAPCRVERPRRRPTRFPSWC